MSSVDLNGHEVGNGGYGQGRSTARRVLLYSERFPITAALIGVSLIFVVLSVAILAAEATARGRDLGGESTSARLCEGNARDTGAKSPENLSAGKQ